MEYDWINITTKVKQWLENYELTMPELYSKAALFGFKAMDMYNYILTPEVKEKHWGSEYTFNMCSAIDKVFNHCLIEFPEIPKQTKHEAKLAQWLLTYKPNLVYRTNYFYHPEQIDNLVAYLTRNPLIYNWNACEVKRMMNLYKNIKTRSKDWLDTQPITQKQLQLI